MIKGLGPKGDALPAFSGFTLKTTTFLRGLKQHNNRSWFERHREDYEVHLLEPAKAFVSAMGERLARIAPGIVAIPKINGSIFRLNRDVRFSADKTPYKSHLGIYLWEGPGRLAGSGFYFHLDPPNLLLGVGIYMFVKEQLLRYRNAIVDRARGATLAAILDTICRAEGFEPGGKRLKRYPAGFDRSHPCADLALHTGLFVGHQTKIPEELYSARLVAYCGRRFERMAPLHRWLVQMSRGEFDR